MLNKLKLGMLIGFALQGLRFVLPDMDVPEGLADALVLVVVFASQFWVKETDETVAKLKLAD